MLFSSEVIELCIGRAAFVAHRAECSKPKEHFNTAPHYTRIFNKILFTICTHGSRVHVLDPQNPMEPQNGDLWIGTDAAKLTRSPPFLVPC